MTFTLGEGVYKGEIRRLIGEKAFTLGKKRLLGERLS